MNLLDCDGFVGKLETLSIKSSADRQAQRHFSWCAQVAALDAM